MSTATQQITITTQQRTTSLPPPKFIGQVEVFDTRQMGEFLGCSSATINKMVTAGILKQYVPLFSRTCKCPRHYVRAADFVAFLEANQ